MDLLETFLRTANALDYLEAFRAENINAKCLKLLVDEDLQMLGIEDVEIRKKIIKQADNLQIISEKRVEMKFDNGYVNTTLTQIIQQMTIFNAMMTPMAMKADIVNVTLPLTTACESLSTAMDDLHKEIVTLKKHILREKGIVLKGDQNRKTCILSGMLLSVFVVTNFIVIRKFISFIHS